MTWIRQIIITLQLYWTPRIYTVLWRCLFTAPTRSTHIPPELEFLFGPIWANSKDILLHVSPILQFVYSASRNRRLLPDSLCKTGSASHLSLAAGFRTRDSLLFLPPPPVNHFCQLEKPAAMGANNTPNCNTICAAVVKPPYSVILFGTGMPGK
jgi:hypothetical protein